MVFLNCSHLVKFVHRTNCYDDRIDFRMDDDIGEDCIWFQVFSKGGEWPPDGCCNRFGPRAIELDREELERWDQKDGWRLWFVEKRRGSNPEHYFHKLALTPFGIPNCGLKSYKRKGWKLLANIGQPGATMMGLTLYQMYWLKDAIGRYLGGVKDNDIANGNSNVKHHLHMCIIRPREDSYFSTPNN